MSAGGAADVAIAGAGIMGAATAYWLTRLEPRLSVVLVERDWSFACASSARSASSIRQQFSTPLNVAMSRFGIEFLRSAPELLGPEHAACLALREAGYLFLAARTEQAEALARACALARAHGAQIALLSPAELRGRFPWLETSDLQLGTLGLEGEGWFDGPALHRALLAAARRQGARTLSGEVRGFERAPGGTVRALALAGGTTLACGHAVNAAGPWAGALARAAGIELPVRARRRTVFVLSSPARLPGCPLVVDASGFWFRPEGEFFLAGTAPREDADEPPLEPDLGEFDEALWARMAQRVPAFAALRVERAWAGYYEMNLFDGNAIVGAHPAAPNLWFITGFSGHGMQHAPAAGRGLAELLVKGRCETLDLAPLGFARLIENRPLVEAHIIG